MSKSIVGARSAGVHHAPITPAQHHFSTPGNHCRLLTQQCYYYTFPGTAVQEGRPSHPLRHFLQKTACFHVQDGVLPSSAPSGGSDFASGNRGIILGAVAQGFNRMELFFKAVVLAAGANVLFNHLVAGHAGSVRADGSLVSIVGCIFGQGLHRNGGVILHSGVQNGGFEHLAQIFFLGAKAQQFRESPIRDDLAGFLALVLFQPRSF